MPEIEREVAFAVRAVANALLRCDFNVWIWGDSVGFDGLVAADEVLGTSKYSSFAYGVGRGWCARRHPFRFLDQTAPGAALCGLAETEQDDGLKGALTELAGYLRARSRVPNGVFQHFAETPVADGPSEGSGPGVFVDAMHFDGPFFAHLARLVDDDVLATEAVRQLAGHVELLRDATGLYSHFWLQQTGAANQVHWGRGQGWAMLGILSALAALPESIDGRLELEEAVRQHALTMREHQLPEGGWRNVVDDDDSYEETSVACFMAASFALGIRMGILDQGFEDAARRAWRRALASVDASGLVRSSSAGTPPGFGLTHYRSIPKDVLVPWGQGPFIVAAQAVRLLHDDGGFVSSDGRT